MKVILLTDVPKVGNKYDVKEFKQGYAENVLLAKGLACLATPKELANLESRKKQMEKKREEQIESFNKLISAVNDKTITIKVKANEKGSLFKSVTPHDVFLSIKDVTGIEIEEKFIVMEHIKNLGVHTISIKMGDRKGECQISVEVI